MARTAAQRRAVASAKKTLAAARRHIASGGSGSSWTSNTDGSSRPDSRTSSGGGSSSGGVSSQDPTINTNPNFPIASGGTSNAFANAINKGTYNPITQTYTSPTGQKSSTTLANAQAQGAIISYGGGGSSGGTSNRFNTISNVQNVARIGQAENTINAIDQNRKTSSALNLPKPNPVVSGLIDNYRKNEENKLQSVGAPDPQFIADSGFKGQITPKETINAQTKVLRDRIKETAERDIREKAEIIGNRNSAKYEEALAAEEQALKNTFNNIQDRINSGGDYNKLTKEFENYQKNADARLKAKAGVLDKEAQTELDVWAKQWTETRGASMEKQAGLVLRSTERLVRLSPSQQKIRFKNAFVGGVVVGGGVTAIVKATGFTLKKSVGVAATGIFAGYSLGKGAVTAGIDVAKGDLARDEYITEAGTRVVEGGVQFLGGFSGAVVGAAVVSTAANLLTSGTARGIKPIEQKLARQAYQKNGLKSRVIKGEVTEGSIKKLSLGTQGKNTLIKEVKVGNVVRKTTYTPETKGLSAAEIKALGKFGVKIDVYSVYDRAGNIIRSVEVARVTGRAPITKIYKGATEIISTGEGTIKGRVSSMTRINVKNQGLGFRDRLTLTGQTKPRLTDISVDKIKGTGAVANKHGFRLEVGAGKSESIFRFNPKTSVLDKTLKTSTSRSSIFSKLTGSNRFSIGNNRVSLNTFKDITGAGSAKPSPNSFFSFFKSSGVPSSKGTGIGGMGKRGSAGLFAPPRVVNKINLNINAPAPKLAPSISLFANNPVSALTKQAGFLALTAPAPVQAAPVYLALNAPAPIVNKNLFLNAPAPKVDNRFFLNAPAPIMTQGFNLLAPAPTTRNAPAPRLFAPAPQIQKPIQKPQPPITTPALNPNPNFNPNTLAGLGGLGFGFGGGGFLTRVKTGGGGIGRKERGGLFGKTRYSASLGSVLTGYRKKGNAQRLSKQTFSGIGLRPLLEKEDKKKKKKKKKGKK